QVKLKALVCHTEIHCSLIDESGKRVELMSSLASQVPLAREGVGQLPDFDIVKGLPEYEQLIVASQPSNGPVPVMISKGRADHDLNMWIDLPNAFDRFHSIPSRWHPHVDKRHSVREATLQGLLDRKSVV